MATRRKWQGREGDERRNRRHPHGESKGASNSTRATEYVELTLPCWYRWVICYWVPGGETAPSSSHQPHHQTHHRLHRFCDLLRPKIPTSALPSTSATPIGAPSPTLSPSNLPISPSSGTSESPAASCMPHSCRSSADATPAFTSASAVGIRKKTSGVIEESLSSNSCRRGALGEVMR